MDLMLLGGSANPGLLDAVAAQLGLRPAPAAIRRFPDGELHVELAATVRGCAVYLLQPTSPPFETHFLELLLLADAARRSGAARLTAVLPYFGYARQDRRAKEGEAVGARVVADVLGAMRFSRIVTVDLHSAALEAAFAQPLEALSAVAELVAHLRDIDDGVVVAPDLGAAHLADRYAAALDLPTAVVHKVRVSGEQVRVRRLTGDVAGRTAIIVDDMISTGGTVEAAVRAVCEAGARDGPIVAATHGLFVGEAQQRLSGLGLRRLVVTDSVALPTLSPLPLRVASVAPLLAEAIRRLHGGS